MTEKTRTEQIEESVDNKYLLKPAHALYAEGLALKEAYSKSLTENDTLKSGLSGALKTSRDTQKIAFSLLAQLQRAFNTLLNAGRQPGKIGFKITGPMVVVCALIATYAYLQINPGLRDSIGRTYSSNPWGIIFIIGAIAGVGAYLYLRWNRKRR